MSELALGGGAQGAMGTLTSPSLILIFLLVFLAVFFIGARTSGLFSALRRARFRSPYRRSGIAHDRGHDLTDVGQQLHAVMAASFQKRRVLSRSEYRVFKIIEDNVAAACRGYRVFAQINLGEILQSTSPSAFHSINSKRVDMLVVDQGGWPVLAVEYQGKGHYQGTAAARDAIKKEALRKAGVAYIEVSETESDDQIRSHVRDLFPTR